MRTRLLLLLLALSAATRLHGQTPRCETTCQPDPTSSTYTNGTFPARPLPQNMRARASVFGARAAGTSKTSSVNAGSDTYNYAVPILGLPGRNGLDVNLVLYYNSRVWTLDPVNNTMTFNADRDFPSYGFRIGYGYIESSGGSSLLTEPDGSKRQVPAGVTIDSSYIF